MASWTGLWKQNFAGEERRSSTRCFGKFKTAILWVPMAEKSTQKKSAKTKPSLWRRFVSFVMRVENRLNSLDRRARIGLVAGAGVLALGLGVVLGISIGSWKPLDQPNGGGGGVPNDPVQTVLETGVLRKETVGGSSVFYLERADNTRISLRTTEEISSAVLAAFEGLAVTVEGILVGDTHSSNGTLQIDKIWLKR